jgi:hypothetical protein
MVCLIMNRPIQQPADDRLFVRTIEKSMGGDTGCWFRFRHATDNDPIVFFTDAAWGENLTGLTNINNQDIYFDWVSNVKEGSVYFNRTTQTYIIVNWGPLHSVQKDKDCPDFPNATLTYSKHQNDVIVPVKGYCGCSNPGMDEEEAKKFEESREENNNDSAD